MAKRALVPVRTLAPVAHPSYRAAPLAGREKGRGKVARLHLAVARWPLAAARPGLADRCRAPAPRVAPEVRGRALVLAPASVPAPLEVRAAPQAVRVLPGCGQVARGRSAGPAPAGRFLAAPTRPTALPLRAVRPTAERRARVRRREVAGVQVVVRGEAQADAAAVAARAGGGAHALTVRSSRLRRRRHMWLLTPPCLRAKSSWNGVPQPKSWRRA
ncbi:MAG TPA: hypothetical protein VMS00_02330 [Acidimicrobiales bacterium]|nr:hypothetical protein [Acidimicrobiales bacterium]